MANAKSILKVSFNESAEQIRGARRSDLVLGFCYRNHEGKEIAVRQKKASALLKDWYGECDFCPENDKTIYRLHILVNSAFTAIDVDEDVKFEQLMNLLESDTKGHDNTTAKGVKK